MAADVGLMFETQKATFSLPNSRSYSGTYRVNYQPGDRPTGPLQVLGEDGVPQVGSVHYEDPSARVRSRSPQCVNASGEMWTVDVEWSNEVNAEDEDENPLNRRTKVRVTYVPDQVIAETTVDGDPIVNSAGSQFLDPIYKDAYRKRITFTRNETDIPNYAEPYLGKVNSSPWYGYETGEAKLTAVDHSDLVTEGDYSYYTVTYVIDIRLNHRNADDTETISGWALEVLDQGTRQKASDPNQGTVPIYLGTPEVEVTTPVNLNGQGLVEKNQALQYFLTFVIDESADLNALNLP